MKTKTKLRKKKQDPSTDSSESSDESDNSASSISSEEAIKKSTKRKVPKDGSDSDSQSSGMSEKNTKHKLKRSKKLKKKRDSSTNSSQSKSDNERIKKKVQPKKSDKKQIRSVEQVDGSSQKLIQEKKSDCETRLKTSRHELESSKWDSPIDKISDNSKNRSVKSYSEEQSHPKKRSASKDRTNHVREWDRGKERDAARSYRNEREDRNRRYDDRNDRGRNHDSKSDTNKNYNRTENEGSRSDYERNRNNGKRYSAEKSRDRYDDNRASQNKKPEYDSRSSLKKPRDNDDNPPRRTHRPRDDDRRNDDKRGGNERRDRSRSNERHQGRGRYRNDRQNDDRRRSPKDDNYQWGKPGQSKPTEKKLPVDKEKPNFGLSGKLTEDVMTYKGVVIKYSEPPEARKPKRRWRLYPFKGEKAMQTLYIHRESAYLLGRERKVVDLPLDHPSCSKQHAALQYRLVPFERENGTTGKRVRPYIIDLESANGTYVNNVKIESRKYVELLEKDVLKFGYSTREYVLLHENSKDEAQDDDVLADEEEEKDIKPKIKKEKLESMEFIIPQEATIG